MGLISEWWPCLPANHVLDEAFLKLKPMSTW